eukprot:TRINITY_DN13586_c0_g1_i2.p1 TRINITY_DN13586_c0_g1~~TRINITY_DN13586_c0_g1_i2.p1  ORF type:complete len:130 (-),score=21.82 TRINITY_DN13586_c0_g1_i2:65-454(-)
MFEIRDPAGEVGGAHKGGAVDQDVQAAQFFSHLLRSRDHCGFIGQVHSQAHGFDPVCIGQFGCGHADAIRIDIKYGHIGPGLGQGFAKGPADISGTMKACSRAGSKPWLFPLNAPWTLTPNWISPLPNS